MKKNTLLFILCVCFSLTFAACKKCKDCEIRTQVNYEDDDFSFFNSDITVSEEFCGEELKAIDGKADVVNSFGFDDLKYEQRVSYKCN
jgi:hypothetical protein